MVNLRSSEILPIETIRSQNFGSHKPLTRPMGAPTALHAVKAMSKSTKTHGAQETRIDFSRKKIAASRLRRP